MYSIAFHWSRRVFLIFPLPSFSSSHGSPATQPPLRRLHSGSPLRFDLAGASLCATRASPSLRKGENAFSTPMKANTQQDENRDHVAYFANRKQPRFIEPRRCELPITVVRCYGERRKSGSEGKEAASFEYTLYLANSLMERSDLLSSKLTTYRV